MCRRVRAVVMLVLVCTLVAVGRWPVGIAAQGIQQVTINSARAQPQVDTQDYAVELYVTVTDGEQNPITDLSKDNFQVLEDGRAVPLHSVAYVRVEDNALIFALDVSGSMTKPDSSGKIPLEQVKQAMENLLLKLSEGDRVAIYAFHETIWLLTTPDGKITIDLITDKGAAVNAVRALKGDDKFTCLYNAAGEAVNKAKVAGDEVLRAVVLFTDGKDEGPGGKPCSFLTTDDVVRRAQEARVPIYTIGLGNNINQLDLCRIAGLTGGRCLIAPDASQLDALFAKLEAQFKGKYLLRYTSQANREGDHRLTVRVSRGTTAAQDERSAYFPLMPCKVGVACDDARPVTNCYADVTCLQARVAKVEFALDNALQKTVDAPPYRFQWDTTGVAAGMHRVSAKVYDERGATNEAAVDVSIEAVSPTPTPEGPTPTPTPECYIGDIVCENNWWLFVLMAVAIIGGGAGILFFMRSRQQQPSPSPALTVTPQPWASTPGPGPSFPPTPGVDDTIAASPAEATQIAPVAFASLYVQIAPTQVQQGQEIPVPTPSCVIGRQAPANVIIDDPMRNVSRRHAEITYDQSTGIYSIRDLGSVNRTKVNGLDVAQGTAQPLKHGDIISLGPTCRLEFRLSGPLPGAGGDLYSTTPLMGGGDPGATKPVNP